jgi:predicted regulator of Ras-like GTPase activity (Roadblock/LC7/MglB family)
MTMQGELRSMDVAALIQLNCQDRKTAQLTLHQADQTATIYFKDGEVIAASLGSTQGEEAVYQLLNWQEGNFALEPDIEPPAITINRSWSGLLLEGAKRLDEDGQPNSELLNDSLTKSQENNPMAKKKSEILADSLTELLRGSSDIEGAAIVGTDGLVYSANVPQRALDENMVGASSAAILGLSKRSTSQLKRGNFKQVLIQGDGGNIIVTDLNQDTLLVGLTSANVNLGMAFAEVRAMTDKLRSVL